MQWNPLGKKRKYNKKKKEKKKYVKKYSEICLMFVPMK